MSKFLLILILLALPGACQNEPAANYLESEGWKIEAEESANNFQIPNNLSGIPWLHYETASKDAGFSLERVAGQEVLLKQFLLQVRGGESGAKVRAAVLVFQGKVVGAWLHTDAPIAPGIASVKNRDFPKNL